MSKAQLRPTLTVGLSQRLAMTPSLLQKIELLTLSRLELSDMLQQELTENPVLEETPVAPEVDVPEAAVEPSDEGSSEVEKDDFDYDYFFGEYLNTGYKSNEREVNDDRPSFDLFLSSDSTLTDHLNWQLNLSEIPPDLEEVTFFIIGNINADGFLTTPLEEVARLAEVEFEAAEAALRIVQSLDPVGVGARDLRECILLQVRAAGLEGSIAQALALDYLDLVEAKKYKEIARQLDCSVEDVMRGLKTLRRFTPCPGQKYGTQKPQYVQPDVYISKNNGEFQVSMNDDGMPKLRLNWAYRQMLKDVNASKETKSFIKEKVRAALELLKSVDQRQQTIYRVCNAIVNRQTPFLDQGLMHLKPMLIKDVAEELGVHSSTISRVVANKYAHTPQGVLELRRFFTVGIESAQGDNISIIQVKHRIKQIIEAESRKKPYSDQQITDMLVREGIQITRRTVAKYRDQMGIGGSRERKLAI